MYLDKELEFFDNENIAASVAAAPVGVAIDTDADNRAIGDVTTLALVVSAKSALTTGAGDVTVTLQHADQNSGYATAITGVATAGALAAGHLVLKLPSGLKRWLRVQVATAANGGVNGLSAQLVLDYQRNVAYPSPTQDF